MRSRSIEKFIAFNRGIVSGYGRDMSKYNSKGWTVELAEGFVFQSGLNVGTYKTSGEATEALLQTMEKSQYDVAIGEVNINSKVWNDITYFWVSGFNPIQKLKFREYMSGSPLWSAHLDLGYYTERKLRNHRESFGAEVIHFKKQFNQQFEA